jgi:ATP synthase protein I
MRVHVASSNLHILSSVFRLPSKPIRTAIRWQMVVILVAALLAGYLAGIHGAVSAVLGGAINVIAALVFALFATAKSKATVDRVMFTALRAEGAKIAVIVALLWVTLAFYKQLSVLAFISTFIVTVLVSSMAFFARDY